MDSFKRTLRMYASELRKQRNGSFFSLCRKSPPLRSRKRLCKTPSKQHIASASSTARSREAGTKDLRAYDTRPRSLEDRPSGGLRIRLLESWRPGITETCP